MVKALREIKTVSNKQVIINLPDYISTKQVEVIIIPYNTSGKENSNKSDYSKYFGISNLGTELIDKKLNDIRDEWEREISD